MNEQSQRELSESEYWNATYADAKAESKDGHEWFRSFADLRVFLLANIPPPGQQPRIIHLGCGTSDVTEGLYDAGYTSQSNVDFSPIAIEAMKSKYASYTDVTWAEMDVRNLQYPDESFDIAFDKDGKSFDCSTAFQNGVRRLIDPMQGTLDAMLWGSLWNPADEVKRNVERYVDEVARSLARGGRRLYVTFRQPHFIRPLLKREKIWTMEVETLGGQDGTFEYFGWIMTKL